MRTNKFVSSVKNTPVATTTENGMLAQESTMNACVDLFFKIGASRGKDITDLFQKAFVEDRDLALRIALWSRDVRGGAGERDLFRSILLFLDRHYPSLLLKTELLDKVPELGRWDDLLVPFTDKKVEAKAYALIKNALNSGNGLCAKWMPRKGPVAAKLRASFGWTPKYYRKRLVELTNVVETAMCSKNWNSINFDHVPSLAMSRYMTAFHRNAPEAIEQYKAKLVTGEAKVNAGAVYPYDIVKSIRYGTSSVNDIADKQWDSLPDYMNGNNILPIVDVSGSMESLIGDNALLSCMDVAVSLGLYTSDKNKGAFKDMFLTFSEKPEFVYLSGTLSEKLRQMQTSHWGMSTDLHAAFQKILEYAVKNDVPQKDMPSMLLILSDMQFNQCVEHGDSAIGMIERKYREAGYKVPAVVFWNINAFDNVPVSYDKNGTALVSGFSPSIMKSVLAADMDNMSPLSIMKQTVMVDRYNYGSVR